MPRCDNDNTGCITKKGVVEELPTRGAGGAGHGEDEEPLEYCPECIDSEESCSTSTDSDDYGISTSKLKGANAHRGPSHRLKPKRGYGYGYGEKRRREGENGDDHSDENEDGYSSGHGKGGRGGRSRRARARARARAEKRRLRYQAWTPAYLGTVFLEKLLELFGIMAYIYADAYRWGLFKSFVLFSYGIKSIFGASQAIKKENERQARCCDLKQRYGPK